MNVQIVIDGNTTPAQLAALKAAVNALTDGLISPERFNEDFSDGEGGGSLMDAIAAENERSAVTTPATSRKRGRPAKGADAAASAAPAPATADNASGVAATAAPTAAVLPPNPETTVAVAPEVLAAAANLGMAAGQAAVEYTADHVRAAMKAFADKHGMAATGTKLNELGFAMVSQVPADRFATVVAAFAV